MFSVIPIITLPFTHQYDQPWTWQLMTLTTIHFDKHPSSIYIITIHDPTNNHWSKQPFCCSLPPSLLSITALTNCPPFISRHHNHFPHHTHQLQPCEWWWGAPVTLAPVLFVWSGPLWKFRFRRHQRSGKSIPWLVIFWWTLIFRHHPSGGMDYELFCWQHSSQHEIASILCAHYYSKELAVYMLFLFSIYTVKCIW